VRGCSGFDTGFLPVGCACGTAAAVEGTASRTATDADVGSVANTPKGDCA
jgi:hypothetical protein